MATADHLLPVWPFSPNWREGVLERLSWGTVVMTSETGSEQRFSSRLSPRRAFEVTFNPRGNVRTFFDLFISELGGQEMMIPLWHDRHKLTSAVESGDVRIDCVTEFGELMSGGMAILVGANPWSHKVVRIDTVDATGFTLIAAADFNWPVGGLVLPLRRSRIDAQPTLSNLTGRVGEANMRFLLNQANDLPDNGEWTGLEYDGSPVMTTPGDWSAALDIEFSRIMETEDNGTGLAFIRDIAERAFRTKKHTWHLRGRESNWQFRQFLYRMAGRRVPVWMPTGNDDMDVAVQANAGATSVQIRQVGLTYVGGPQPGRDRFLAKTPDGYQVRQITSLGAPLLPSYERLNVAALTYALPAGTNLQFLEMMRADGDDIELMHHTDTEGMTECSINYRSFNNARVPATPIFVPVPVSVETFTECGTGDADEDGSCYPPSYEGWVWEWMIFCDMEGDGYPSNFLWILRKNGVTVNNSTGRIREQITTQTYRYLKRQNSLPTFDNVEDWRLQVDPQQQIPPGDGRNSAQYTLYGRHWTSLTYTEYATHHSNSGGISYSPYFAVPGIPS